MGPSHESIEAIAQGYVEYLGIRKPTREFRMGEEYRRLTEMLFKAQDLAYAKPAHSDSWRFFVRAAAIAGQHEDKDILGNIGEGLLEDWLRSNLDDVVDQVVAEASTNELVREMLGSVVLRRSNGDPASIAKIKGFVYAIDNES